MNVRAQCLPVQEGAVAVIRVSPLAVISRDLLNKYVKIMYFCNSPATASAESELDLRTCTLKEMLKTNKIR